MQNWRHLLEAGISVADGPPRGQSRPDGTRIAAPAPTASVSTAEQRGEFQPTWDLPLATQRLRQRNAPPAGNAFDGRSAWKTRKPVMVTDALARSGVSSEVAKSS